MLRRNLKRLLTLRPALIGGRTALVDNAGGRMGHDELESPELTFNDGNTIPQLGYGVWKVEDDVATDVVQQAFDAGYRHIDTARIYGNEEGVGRALAAPDVPRETSSSPPRSGTPTRATRRRSRRSTPPWNDWAWNTSTCT